MSFKKLISWSNQNYSDLPWRKNRSLYFTLVSEIMLQQTTVTTVLNHFDRFIKKYPDIFKLANASEEEMAVAWKGLGYYRRAKNLRNAAITIVNDYNGDIPLNFEQLIKINGIGEYTANALIAIGANKRAIALDANLERVLSRIYQIDNFNKGPKLLKEIYRLFNENKILKNQKSYRELNESLMDLGRTYCQSRKVYCESCPISNNCNSYKSLDPLTLPKSELKNKKQKFYELDLLRVIVKKKKSLLGVVKKESQWLSNQIELPTFILKSEDKNLKNQYPKFPKRISYNKLSKYKTSITKYKITNYIIEMNESEFEEIKNKEDKFVTFSLKNIQEQNVSTATLKGINKWRN